jgi:hypothetical protein
MTGETRVVSARVPDALAARLNHLADHSGRTLSEIMRDAVEAFLHPQPPPVTLIASHGARIRIRTPVWPMCTENSNPVTGQQMTLTHIPGIQGATRG